MRTRIKGVSLTVVILLAIAGLFAGLYVFQHMHATKKINTAAFYGTYLNTPRPINNFSLMGTNKKVFDNQSLAGHWTLLFMGFTNCGYLCPTSMAELGKMYKILEKKGIKDLPHVVMVSIDPKRDTLEKLGQYVTSFHPAFYGALGQEKFIKAMAQEMGIAYMKVANKSDLQNYDIQHSGAIMLFNAQGELNAFFTTPHHAELLAKDYMLLVS